MFNIIISSWFKYIIACLLFEIFILYLLSETKSIAEIPFLGKEKWTLNYHYIVILIKLFIKFIVIVLEMIKNKPNYL
jgi:hypothetical protein